MSKVNCKNCSYWAIETAPPDIPIYFCSHPSFGEEGKVLDHDLTTAPSWCPLRGVKKFSLEPYTKEELEPVENGLIMLCKIGSHAYGLNTPSSDLDLAGVYVGPKEHVIGINRSEQFDKFKSADMVVYEITKFLKLASACNPNILELIFTDEYIYKNEYFERILDHKDCFLSKRAAFKFLGYANDQLKRIKGHKKWINDPQPTEPPKLEDFTRRVYQEVGIGSMDEGFSEDRPFVEIYDKDAYKGAHSKWKQYWHWKKNRNPERAKLEEKFGYDTKHAMHLIRLLTCMEELLGTGMLTVNRETVGDRQYLLDVRNGKYTYEEIIAHTEAMMENVDERADNSVLPRRPKFKTIDNLLVNTYDNFWKCENYKKFDLKNILVDGDNI